MTKENRTGCEDCGMCGNGGMEDLAKVLAMGAMGMGGAPGIDEIEMALSGEFPGMLGDILSQMDGEGHGPRVRVISSDGMPDGLKGLLGGLLGKRTFLNPALKDEDNIPAFLRERLNRFIALYESGSVMEVNGPDGSHEMALGQGLREKEDGFVVSVSGKCPRVIDSIEDPETVRLIKETFRLQAERDVMKEQLDQLRDKYGDLQIEKNVLRDRIEDALREAFPKLHEEGAHLSLKRNLPDGDQPESKTFFVVVDGEPDHEQEVGEALNKLGFELEGVQAKMDEHEAEFKKIHGNLSSDYNPVDASLNMTGHQIICGNILEEGEALLGIAIDPENDAPCVIAIGKVEEELTEVPNFMKRSVVLRHLSGKGKAPEGFLKKLGVAEQVAEIEQLLEKL